MAGHVGSAMGIEKVDGTAPEVVLGVRTRAVSAPAVRPDMTAARRGFSPQRARRAASGAEPAASGARPSLIGGCALGASRRHQAPLGAQFRPLGRVGAARSAAELRLALQAMQSTDVLFRLTAAICGRSNCVAEGPAWRGVALRCVHSSTLASPAPLRRDARNQMQCSPRVQRWRGAVAGRRPGESLNSTLTRPLQ